MTAADNTDGPRDNGNDHDDIPTPSRWASTLNYVLGVLFAITVLGLGIAQGLFGFSPSPQWGALLAGMALVLLGFGALVAKVSEVIA